MLPLELRVADENLHDVAETSFTTKCVNDAVWQ